LFSDLESLDGSNLLLLSVPITTMTVTCIILVLAVLSPKIMS